MVVCGAPDLEDGDILLNPALVIEVLADSTEAYDRGAKFGFYRDLPGVREYLLVSQREPRLEQYVRQPDGHWRYATVAAGELPLPSVGAILAVERVYDGVPRVEPA